MQQSINKKELADTMVEEALHALTKKPVRCTTLERVRIFCEAHHALPPQLPQPLKLGRGLLYALERISLPLKPTDLLVGRISEEVPDEEGEAFIEELLRDPEFPVALRPNWMLDGGHCSFYWKELMELGLSGLKARAENELARRTAAGEAQPRLDFLQGAVHIYEAMQLYLCRWADAARAAGLTDAAQACAAVAQREPRTFREGLQLLWIIHLVFCTMLAGNPTLALGKMDRLLQPLYDADLAAGRLTRQEAGLLILDFYCKHNLIMGRGEHQMSQDDPEQFSGWHRQLNCDAPQYLVLGGTNADGSSACTDLSLLFAECVVPRFKNPVMVIHYSPEMAQKHPAFWRVCVDKMRQSASMMVYNEKAVTAAYIRAGADPQDAAEFEHFGCNWPCIPGMENDIAQMYPIHPEEDRLSTLAVAGEEAPAICRRLPVEDVRDWLLQCAADGREPDSIEELYDCLGARMKQKSELLVRKHRLFRDMVTAKAPGVLLFADCFTAESITRAANLDTGGSKYHTVRHTPPGLATLADSVTAIDWLVFQKKKLTAKQLAAALEADFEGYPAVLSLCRNAPKLGQDHALANAHAGRLLTLWTDHISAAQALPGETPGAARLLVELCIQTDTGHIRLGAQLGATPDGRRAGAPISQNCQPTEGVCVNGLSARLCSMASLPFERITSGAQNISIQPRAFAGERGLDLLAGTLAAYFDMGGLQTQISAVSTEDLRAAQRDPDAHRDLMVRITGYSAVFVDMAEAAQNEIIRREEMQE